LYNDYRNARNIDDAEQKVPGAVCKPDPGRSVRIVDIANTKLETLVKEVYLAALEEGRGLQFIVSGSSMHPFMKSGDIVTIEDPAEGLEIGDIAIVDTGSGEELKFLGHRIVKKVEEKGRVLYFMKGDNHTGGINGPLRREAIRGRVGRLDRGEISFDMNRRLARLCNRLVAFFSFRAPRALIAMGKVFELGMEWRWIIKKVKNRIRKGHDPLLYNTEELLLMLARSRLPEELVKKAVAIVREGVDWERFRKLAVSQGVSVLIYDSLAKIEQHIAIPHFVTKNLKNSSLYTFAKNSASYRETRDILGLFSSAGVPVIPLKGPYLSERIYGDIAAHGIGADIDLLIKEDDRERVRSLLEGAGYRLNPSDEIPEWQWQCSFSKDEGCVIDVHWDITMGRRTRRRIEELWREAGTEEEKRSRCYELKEEELLLYLAAHLVSNSCFRQLRYLCDIHELVSRCGSRLDWGSVTVKAQRWGLSASLYAALTSAKMLLGTMVPAGVLRKIKPHLLGRLLLQHFAHRKTILRSGIRRRVMDNLLGHIFFEAVEGRSAKDFFSIVKRAFFPPKEAIRDRCYLLWFFKGAAKRLVKVLTPE
jgi:hypothetical protein